MTETYKLYEVRVQITQTRTLPHARTEYSAALNPKEAREDILDRLIPNRNNRKKLLDKSLHIGEAYEVKVPGFTINLEKVAGF